jgi:hypothetical protein
MRYRCGHPAVFVTLIPAWTVGVEFLVPVHHWLRMIAIDCDLADDLVQQRINAITVEPS